MFAANLTYLYIVQNVRNLLHRASEYGTTLSCQTPKLIYKKARFVINLISFYLISNLLREAIFRYVGEGIRGRNNH